MATLNVVPSSGTSWSRRPVMPSLTCGNWWSFPSVSPPMKPGLQSCWPRRLNTRAKPCSRYCSRTVRSISFRSSNWKPGTRTMRPRRLASTCKKACSRSTPSLAVAMATTSPRLIATTVNADCAGRWSTARRLAGVIARALTRTSRPAVACSSMATRTKRRSSLPCPMSRRPKPRMPTTRSG
ncbi:hypothetical protein D3C79_705510 [compost metagenome]